MGCVVLDVAVVDVDVGVVVGEAAAGGVEGALRWCHCCRLRWVWSVSGVAKRRRL